MSTQSFQLYTLDQPPDLFDKQFPLFKLYWTQAANSSNSTQKEIDVC